MKIIRDMNVARNTVLRRFPGESVDLPSHVKGRIIETFGEQLTADDVVRKIIAKVSDNGDAALHEYTQAFDGVDLERFEIPKSEITTAKENVDVKLLDSLRVAAGRIEEFHRKQREKLPIGKTELGDGVGQIMAPLERVGVYAPGGTASYPSTVLMTVIPAKMAGVDEVILATPPRQDGCISPLTLVAAELSGADRVFCVGGAPAIAALAYGTESVPKVDKICGPGNIFVMLAKKQVFGMVDIDGLQGPTETLVLADESANSVSCAADLLAQAEHDEMSSAIMITTSMSLAEKVSDEVGRQLVELERSSIASKSLDQHGAIVVTGNMDEAINLVNMYAPEHLCLLVNDADTIVPKIRHSGGIFIGESSPEVLGDYVAGPSHVMPTGGTARFSSPVNVTDFLKITSLVYLSDSSFKELGSHAAAIARAEGLSAHARAVERRSQ